MHIWAVSDGRAGLQNQVLGLAEAVGRLRSCRITTKRVRWRSGLGRLPTWANPGWTTLNAGDALNPPWPDLWIAAGRASLPLSLRARRLTGGRSLVVQVQDPGWPAERFDLVAPPEHDGLVGENVTPILGSPNRVTPEGLATELRAFAALLEPLPRPRVAVLIGGRSRAYDLPPARAAALADEIVRAVAAVGGSLLATFSRRTPERAKAAMAERLARSPGMVWDGAGPNPYYAFLAAADAAVVTADSTNMATEAATAGVPVLVADLPGGSAKFERLHAGLRAQGAARPFAGRIETWRYPPLRETERLAAELLRRWDARAP